MADETTVELDTKNLDKLTKALKREAAKIRVGILNSGAARSDKKTVANNAAIGAFHEFGTSRLPVRSFLRVPITDHLAKRLESSGALDKNVLKQVIAEQTIIPWLRKVAVLAEQIVADAFASGGFGKWRPSNMTGKHNQQTLVETGQLRNSITSEIKE
jgi:phage gpG-like protein